MLPIFDIHLNRQKLQNLSQGNDVFIQLCDAAAQGLIGRIPDFITSYKPCAETILTIMDVPHPSEAAANMETSLHNKMLELGKRGNDGIHAAAQSL